MHRNNILIITLGFFFNFTLLNGENIPEQKIQLSAYSGYENILLKWEKPTHKEISTVRILKSRDMLSTFEVIELNQFAKDRYLDVHVNAEELIFYIVEWTAADGTISKSSTDKPAFARVKSKIEQEAVIAVLAQQYPETMAALNTIGGFNDILFLLLQDYLNSTLPVNLESADAFISFFADNETDGLYILDLVTIDDFNKLNHLFKKDLRDVFIKFFDSALDDIEILLRNQILKTNSEWKTKKQAILLNLDEKFSQAVILYHNDQQFLKTLAPARINQILINPEEMEIRLMKINENFSSAKLFFDDDYSEILFETGSIQKVHIPPKTNQIKLMINDEIIQTIEPMHENGTLTISGDDQYIFEPNQEGIDFFRSIPRNKFQLNELAFDVSSRQLQVEICNTSNESAILGIFIDDKLIWEWFSQQVFEPQFMDSSWVIESTNDNAWVHLKTNKETDEWITLESRPFNTKKNYHECKIPDLGQWTHVSFSSFGESNDITQTDQSKLIIPELFALYQNFPNPFNGKTKITFDLLEESNVDLFIADARGRKLHTFLEQTFLNRGLYTFEWEAVNQSSGVYFITMQAQHGNFLPVVMSRKMIYLK